MPGARESNEIKKSMAYDLIRILESEENADQKTYSTEDVKNLINNYITVSATNN